MSMATVEATTQKVQRMLVAKFKNVMLAEDGFAIEMGSSRVNIEIKDFGKDDEDNPRTIVHLWAPVGREVKPSPELFRWVAVEAQEYFFGATLVVVQPEATQCLVIFKHTLLGDFLDLAELEAAVGLVAVAADEYDDIVKTKFGGKRYADA
jgi:hypothetical protein